VSRTRVFAIANQKGGVGKTTTTINLAAYLADAGRKTLVIDLDPQSNTTTGLGVDAHRMTKSIYEMLVLDRFSFDDVLIPEIRPNLALLPAKVDLYAAELELVDFSAGVREFRLLKALDPVKSRYDYILIDCPPSLGLLTLNGLTAADGVILPVQCEYFALEGMAELLKTIQRVRDRLNTHLELFGVVLTMYDARTSLSAEVVKEVRGHFSREAFRTTVGRNVKLSEAPSYGLTILQHDPRSSGALAYKALAEEVIERAEAGVTTNA
jgi:chromosome partitioning protein